MISTVLHLLLCLPAYPNYLCGPLCFPPFSQAFNSRRQLSLFFNYIVCYECLSLQILVILNILEWYVIPDGLFFFLNC